jgi:hypothetical protein
MGTGLNWFKPDGSTGILPSMPDLNPPVLAVKPLFDIFAQKKAIFEFSVPAFFISSPNYCYTHDVCKVFM